MDDEIRMPQFTISHNEGVDPAVAHIVETMTRRQMREFYGRNPLAYFSAHEEIFEAEREPNVKSKKRNRKLAEWSISARALKHLLKRIENGGYGLCHDYKFGAMYNEKYKMWFIFNKTTNNNIATLRERGAKMIVRYRPNSHYATVFENYEFERRSKVIRIPTENIGRHNEFVRSQAHYINNDLDGQMGFRKAQYDRKHNR